MLLDISRRMVDVSRDLLKDVCHTLIVMDSSAVNALMEEFNEDSNALIVKSVIADIVPIQLLPIQSVENVKRDILLEVMENVILDQQDVTQFLQVQSVMNVPLVIH